jgi:hypothetical protein
MTADLTIAAQGSLNDRGRRLHAFLSSLLAVCGAGLAAAAFISALVISLPLMVAASVTYNPATRRRRGWQELEPVEA